MEYLNQKKVLLISPKFYDYPKYIGEGIKLLGAEVTIVYERPRKFYYFSSFLSKISFILLQQYCLFFLDKKLKSLRENYDYVLVLKGEIINRKLIKSLKKKFPDAVFIFYNWDSFKANPNALSIYQLFDHRYSFDPCDCQRFKDIIYQPTFYIEYFKNKDYKQEQILFDVLFVGNSHTDRKKILKKLAITCDEQGLVSFIYLLTKPWNKLWAKLLDKQSCSMLRTEPMRINKLQKLMAQSRAIIDIESKGQTGLTMRTFEALAMGKKLITTNHHIKNEPFFDPDMICILSRQDPRIEKKFLEKPNRVVDLSKFSLQEWLIRVLQI